jgi:hypothetical protein
VQTMFPWPWRLTSGRHPWLLTLCQISTKITVEQILLYLHSIHCSLPICTIHFSKKSIRFTDYVR